MKKIIKRSKDPKTVIVSKCLKDDVFRRELVKNSLFWFIHIYFPDYITYPLAEFQREIINILESNSPNIGVAGFRGSGKSTIVSLAYVIWSMIGLKKRRFIVLMSNTARQSEMLMFNIKNILESHPLLKKDLGPFQETSEEWNIGSLIFKDYDAKIMAISVNESIRGVRYKNKRPSLIVIDDAETLDSVKTSDNREKLLTWFDRDIVPLGDESTVIVIVGTIMTEGSLMHTIRQRIETGQLNGVFKKYPIVDDDGKPLWTERWQDANALELFKKDKGILERTWQTEYLLNDFISEDQLIKLSDENFYTEIPFGKYPDVTSFIAVDLAISEEDSADKTAIIQGYMFRENGGRCRLYLLPNPCNKRMGYHETLEEIKNKALEMKDGKSTYIIVENVGYQRAMIEVLKREGFYNAIPFEVRNQDKRSRLSTTVHHLALGDILLPRYGCEVLIDQLIRFGYERYKDLADAFSMIVIKSFEIKDSVNNVIRVKVTGLKNDIEIGDPDPTYRTGWRRMFG